MFNTPLVTKMANILYGCCSIKSLDLSNFNTSLFDNMYVIFLDNS